MTQIEHLREQAARAERLARHLLDTAIVARLLQASEDYRQEAQRLEQTARCGTVAEGPMRVVNGQPAAVATMGRSSDVENH